MGLYVEIMCDVMKEWQEGSGHIHMRCVSHRGDNPQGHTVAEARKQAKRQGWLVVKGYDVCPNCKED